MKFSKSKLLNALAKCMPGVSTGTVTLEGADSFVFRDGYVHTYNAEVSVSVKLDENIPAGIVNAKDLYSMLSKLPEDECELTIDQEKGDWILTCKKIKVKLHLANFDNIFDRFQNIVPDDTKWADIDGEEFNLALKDCLMPSNKTSLAGIAIKDNQMISTDQTQVNIFTFEKSSYPQARIGNDAAKSLMAWKTFKKVQFNKTWLQFADDEKTIFSVKTFVFETFPFDKIAGVIQTTDALEKIVSDKLSEEFFIAIDRAAGFAAEDDKEHLLVRLEFSDKGMAIMSRKASGEYEELIEDKKYDVNYDGNFDVRSLMSLRGKNATLDVFKGVAVPGKPVALRFKFTAGTFQSVLASF